MNHQNFYSSIHSHFLKQSPSLQSIWTHPADLERLMSPYALRLPSSVHDQGQELVESLWQLSRESEYQALIKNSGPEILKSPPPHASVLMAYDFHCTIDKQLKLIEVNTNASGFLLAQGLYQSLGLSDFLKKDPVDLLLQSFASDYSSFKGEEGLGFQDIKHLAIVDSSIREQKMLPEFFLYQDLFKKNSVECSIYDVNDLRIQNRQVFGHDHKPIDFIYNRHTDFYLEQANSQNLREAYVNHLTCLSPHPFEYALLADKQRLIDWQKIEDFKKNFRLQNYLLKTSRVDEIKDSEEIWKQRKNLFFKPLRSHGGKRAYRGSSISRRLFNEVMGDSSMLIQESCPPGTPPFCEKKSPDQTKGWKYDLRFYAYQGQVQMVVARIYQGQLTNFSSPYGGFSAVHFD